MEPARPLITFHLDRRSGVAPYLQLIQQVKQFLQLGYLQPGDQLPSVREVVAQLTINPNTVLRAYHELELAGLIGSRPGRGMFVLRTPAGPSSATYVALQAALAAWFKEAYAAGLKRESIEALIAATHYQITSGTEEASA